ncbi:MAG: MotE family protein [Eubacteriales bacterium]
MANKEKSKKTFFLPMLLGLGITFILLGGFILLIKFDIGGLGNQVMRPLINDVSGLNVILPNEIVNDDEETKDEYTFETIEEAIEALKATEGLLSNKREEVKELNNDIERLVKEIEKLKEFEEKYVEFQGDKAEFDEKVVFNDKAPDINSYKDFYESISPQNAEKIYQKVVEKNVYDDEVRKYAQTFQDMKADEAAGILEEMATDLDLVVLILENIASEQRGKILGAMTPRVASKITKKMAP